MPESSLMSLKEEEEEEIEVDVVGSPPSLLSDTLDGLPPTPRPASPSNDAITPSSEPLTPSSEPLTPSSEPLTPSSEPLTPSSDPVTPCKESSAALSSLEVVPESENNKLNSDQSAPTSSPASQSR